MKKIIETLKTRYKSQIRVGFVGYRDKYDSEQFIITPFSTDTDHVIREMNKIEADGGGDTPEDLHGGLEVSNNLRMLGTMASPILNTNVDQ